jgi:hypothetical protein
MLPYQLLKQEMARLSLARAHTNEIRTADPAKLEANSVRSNDAAFDVIGQKGQAFRPAKTLDDVAL